MNKKVIRLENNKEYFAISELDDNNIKYLLLMNVDNESDIIVAKKINVNNEDYIEEVTQADILSDLKPKFKSLIDNEKNIYA